MTHIYLVRHADYIYDLVDGRYQDLGLSSDGTSQAERLRDRIAAPNGIRPDVFISSSERGARETAEVLSPTVGAPLILDDQFVEWRSDDGSLDPEEFMRMWRDVPDRRKGYYRWVEGGESRAEMALRVQLALDRVLAEHAGKTILVVSHGAFIQCSFMYFFGFGEACLRFAVPEIRRTSITHWKLEDGRWVLERSNDCHHLE